MGKCWCNNDSCQLELWLPLVKLSPFPLFVVTGLAGGTNFMSILLWLCRSFNLNLKCYPAKCNRHTAHSPQPRPLKTRHSFSTYLQLPHFIISPLPASQPALNHFIYTPVYICHTFVFVSATHFLTRHGNGPFLTAFLCVSVKSRCHLLSQTLKPRIPNPKSPPLARPCRFRLYFCLFCCNFNYFNESFNCEIAKTHRATETASKREHTKAWRWAKGGRNEFLRSKKGWQLHGNDDVSTANQVKFYAR